MEQEHNNIQFGQTPPPPPPKPPHPTPPPLRWETSKNTVSYDQGTKKIKPVLFKLGVAYLIPNSLYITHCQIYIHIQARLQSKLHYKRNRKPTSYKDEVYIPIHTFSHL